MSMMTGWLRMAGVLTWALSALPFTARAEPPAVTPVPGAAAPEVKPEVLSSFDQAEVDKLERVKKGLGDAVIWYLSPKEEMWASFEWTKIEGKRREKMISHLKQAAYSPKAGNGYLLDIPFKDAQARHQGYLVIVMPGETVAYVRIPAPTEQKGLGAVDVKKFDPEKKSFERENKFIGILLPVPSTEFLK